MLGISNNNTTKNVSLKGYSSMDLVANKKYYKKYKWFFRVLFLVLALLLFLPWTQNIKGKGYLTTLGPEQRPQKIQSAIAGRVQRWFIREGDFVNKGDTLLEISEIKSDYFDAKIADRTQDQLNFKVVSVQNYTDKIAALECQIIALKKERSLKMDQLNNKLLQAKIKVKSDSVAFEMAQINKDIADRQYRRVSLLHQEGLKALKDVEEKKMKKQSALVKLMQGENKLLKSKNEVINARIEVSRTQTSYQEKIAKVESTLFTANASKMEAQSHVSKLETVYANYLQRRDLRFITAPQDGYINKAFQTGIGTTFKAGQELLSIMPANYQMAISTYIKPIDMPLISKGVKVRIQFDGWPAIIFSGWDVISYGTYGGTVVAIEQFISENGKYRVLISPDPQDHPWPKGIRMGSGARTIALLNDVPIWYELWRQINGFPLDFYKVDNSK